MEAKRLDVPGLLISLIFMGGFVSIIYFSYSICDDTSEGRFLGFNLSLLLGIVWSIPISLWVTHEERIGQYLKKLYLHIRGGEEYSRGIAKKLRD